MSESGASRLRAMIDWRILHAICHHHLDGFRVFARAVTETEQP